MKKFVALMVVACFAGSVIAQTTPQTKTAPVAQERKDKDHDGDHDKDNHHRHHHHHEHEHRGGEKK